MISFYETYTADSQGKRYDFIGRNADNDRNALLIAKLAKANVLYIVTNTNGVYRDKDKPESRINTLSVDELTDGFIEKITGGKSERGTGGMYSKLMVAREAAENGIETRIIDGTTSTIGNFQYRKDYAGTTILARK
ncbi:hypothetical protein GW819_02390 [Candidatus Gracilibacteria bacterium]|nr:hypothetical protein [Candidatus Gracilibacteria bacterium]PIQ41668.1 MAG: hypothetical protein COW06_02235 [Candidatus Gracilibacteria bacterium CG12_big_fil_rev_8_21_14_0_65_38_15]PIZ01778.1 MAG: hypothetical protein COY60_01775 [Candidatus Gracilibacteria bacterium CG_4_10_14_0_8_um_filter_38_28]